MLTTLSILSPDQGKLHPGPRSEAGYFASFAQARQDAAVIPVPTILTRLAGCRAAISRIARTLNARLSGR